MPCLSGFTAHPMLAVGVLGVLVRLLFIWDSRGDPSFIHPLVDAKTYHDLASGYSSTGWNEKFLWQAAYYPAFLTFVYKVAGVSVLTVKVLQAVIGGISCALTCRLGRDVHSQRAGVIAGLILVFYGPVLFFESRLLATGWAILWTVALALLLVHVVSKPSARSLLLVGVTLALAVYTRPTFVLVGAIYFVFLLMPGLGRQQVLRRIRNTAIVIAGFVVVAGPVSVYFRATTGFVGLIPPSGGINFFIGNNPDYSTTVNIRPGLAWADLVAEPSRHGYEDDPWSRNKYFREQVVEFASNEPIRCMSGLGEKFLTLISSREIPRNLDVYIHRKWSRILTFVTWNAGGWGVPFGLVFPFALVGIAYSKSRNALLIKIMLGVLSAAVVLVFISARYKAPLIPLVSVMAAIGVTTTVDHLRNRNLRDVLVIGGLLASGFVFCVAPGPFAQESFDLRAELYFGVAEDLYDQEEWEQAAEFLDRSIALDSEVHAAHQIMGIAMAELERYDESVYHFEEAVRLRPDHVATISNLEQSRRYRSRANFLAGREVESNNPVLAIGKFREATKDMPTWYRPLAREAFILATTVDDSLRDGERAVMLAVRAIELRGEPDAYLKYVLAAALAETGRYSEAFSTADEAGQIVVGGTDRSMMVEIQRAKGLFKDGLPVRR